MKRGKLYILRTMSSIILLMQLTCLNAQGNGTDGVMRRFVRMLNMEGKTPLDMHLQINYSVNLQTQPDDTLNMQGEFYLRSHASYVRMGEQEQLLNDSMVLIVSDNLQRMILYPRAKAMVDYMRNLPGMQWSDSSIKQLALQFKVSEESKTQLVLSSKQLLPGTKLPRSNYVLYYDAETAKPIELSMTQRILVGVDSLQYGALKQYPSYDSNLFTKEGMYFFIKEKKLTILYKKIEQPDTDALPVTIGDRIEWTKEGQIKPVGKYLLYQLVNAE